MRWCRVCLYVCFCVWLLSRTHKHTTNPPTHTISCYVVAVWCSCIALTPVGQGDRDLKKANTILKDLRKQVKEARKYEERSRLPMLVV